jgi:hypothetical protein
LSLIFEDGALRPSDAEQRYSELAQQAGNAPVACYLRFLIETYGADPEWMQLLEEQVWIEHGPTAFPALNELHVDGFPEERVAQQFAALTHAGPGLEELADAVKWLQAGPNAWSRVVAAAERLRPAQESTRLNAVFGLGPYRAAAVNRALARSVCSLPASAEIERWLDSARQALQNFENAARGDHTFEDLLDQVVAQLEDAQEAYRAANLAELDAACWRLDVLASQVSERYTEESRPVCSGCGRLGSWINLSCPSCGQTLVGLS